MDAEAVFGTCEVVLAGAGRAVKMEIPLGERCRVASSSRGRYIAAGAGTDILVAKSSNGEILRHMRGHTKNVTCIAFAAEGTKIVSGSWDKKVMVWQWDSSESGEQVLEGHSGVTDVAETNNGGHIYSCSTDGTVRAWDTATGTEAGIVSQGSKVLCIAVCGENRMIALGLRNGALRVLDCGTKDVLFEDTEAHKSLFLSVSFSPTGSYVATRSRQTIRVWNTRTWTRVGNLFEGHASWVTSVAFSPNGQTIVSGSHDGTIRLWDVESATCVGVSPKISSPISSVSFTGDGNRIVSGSPDGVVRIWNARLQTKSKRNFYGHSTLVSAVAICQDATRVCSAEYDGTVRVWDTQTGEQIGPPLNCYIGLGRCVSLSPDGRLVVSSSMDNILRLWVTETGTQVGHPFEGHTGTVECVSFSADGRRVVSGSGDKTVRIWIADAQEQIGDALGASSGISVRVREF